MQFAGKIDWEWIDGEIALLYSDKGLHGDAANAILTATGSTSASSSLD